MAVATDDCSAPLMEYEEIITAITGASDGNVIVSAQDLKKITAEKVIEIYKSLLFSLYERASEQLSQVPYKVLADQGKNYCLFEDVSALSYLFLALDKTFVASGINNFSLKDLTNPKPKRTQRLLSSLVNSLRHIHSKQDVIEDALSYAFECNQKREENIIAKEECIQRLNDIEIRNKEEGDRLNKLKPEAEAWRTRLNDLTTLQSEYRKDCEEEEKHLEDKRIFLHMLKTEDGMNEKQRVAVERRSLLDKLDHKDIQLQQLDEDSKSALKLMVDFNSVQGRIGNNVKELVEVKDKVSGLEKEYQNLAVQIQNVRRQLNSKRDRLTRIQSQSRKRLSSTIELLTLEQKKLTSKKNEIQAKKGECLAKLETERNEISELRQLERLDFEAKAHKATDTYRQILDELDKYHQNYASYWERFLATTNDG